MKTCKHCGVAKPLSEFINDKRTLSGKGSKCVECNSAWHRENYAKNREVISERNRNYYWENRGKESARKAKAYLENTEVMLARNRRWREANRDREREQHKEYYKNNPHIFAKSGSNRKEAWSLVEKFSVSKRDLQRLLARWGNCCAFCGKTGVKLSWDHVMPISRGGPHGIGNILPACRPCNSSKNNRTITEWILSGTAPVGVRLRLSRG